MGHSSIDRVSVRELAIACLVHQRQLMLYEYVGRFSKFDPIYRVFFFFSKETTLAREGQKGDRRARCLGKSMHFVRIYSDKERKPALRLARRNFRKWQRKVRGGDLPLDECHQQLIDGKIRLKGSMKTIFYTYDHLCGY